MTKKRKSRAPRPARRESRGGRGAARTPSSGETPWGVPLRRRSTWEVGVRLFPEWVYLEGDEAVDPPALPWALLAVETGTGRPVVVRRFGIGAPPSADEAAEALLEEVRGDGSTGYLPGTIRAATPELVIALGNLLEAGGVEVDLARHQGSLEEHLRRLAGGGSGPRPGPGIATVPGLPREFLRSFHEAARLFVESRVNAFLGIRDFVRVEAPDPPDRAFRWLAIVPRHGRPGGIAWYARAEDHAATREPGDRFERATAVYDCSHLPYARLEDLEAYRLLGLPPVGPWRGYPVAVDLRRRRAPGPRVLAFIEAVLRALAATRFEDAKRGRWMVRVGSAAGPVEVTLALPALLGESMPATTLEGVHARDALLAGDDGDPRNRALNLAVIALDQRNMERWELLGRALEIDPDCPDARMAFAGLEDDPGRRLHALRAAALVARRRWEEWREGQAGAAEDEPPPRAPDEISRERAGLLARLGALTAGESLPEDREDGGEALVRRLEEVTREQVRATVTDFPVLRGEDDPRDLMASVEGRVLQRALEALARELLERDRPDEVVDLLRPFLAFPDRSDFRYLLLEASLLAGRTDLPRLLAATWGKAGADPEGVIPWVWLWPLLHFMEGDLESARGALRLAHRESPGVVDGIRFGPGMMDDEEAELAAEVFFRPWRKVPGALAWLARELGEEDAEEPRD